MGSSPPWKSSQRVHSHHQASTSECLLVYQKVLPGSNFSPFCCLTAQGGTQLFGPGSSCIFSQVLVFLPTDTQVSGVWSPNPLTITAGRILALSSSCSPVSPAVLFASSLTACMHIHPAPHGQVPGQAQPSPGSVLRGQQPPRHQYMGALVLRPSGPPVLALVAPFILP